MPRLLFVAFWLALAACSEPSKPDARRIHERLLTLDTHLDTPAAFANAGWNIAEAHRWVDDLSQVDLPRMKRGGLDGGFWAIYTPQGPRTPEGYSRARDQALMTAVRIRELTMRPGFALALKADDAAPIVRRKQRVVFLSIENSYPLTADLTLLDTFYELGVRLLGPVHTTNNDFADSSTDQPEWHGLSERGRALLERANQLGMILDASHASDEVLDQMIELSKTPVMLSHSGCKAVFAHPRNVDDARLKKLAARGGIIQINSLSDYLIATPDDPERKAAFKALFAKYGHPLKLAPEPRQRFVAEKRAIERAHPAPRATFEDYMAHVLHALKLLGPDHVGIGADWDGGGGVTGACSPKATPSRT
jgi:membrane dipeptidase